MMSPQDIPRPKTAPRTAEALLDEACRADVAVEDLGDGYCAALLRSQAAHKALDDALMARGIHPDLHFVGMQRERAKIRLAWKSNGFVGKQTYLSPTELEGHPAASLKNAAKEFKAITLGRLRNSFDDHNPEAA